MPNTHDLYQSRLPEAQSQSCLSSPPHCPPAAPLLCTRSQRLVDQDLQGESLCSPAEAVNKQQLKSNKIRMVWFSVFKCHTSVAWLFAVTRRFSPRRPSKQSDPPATALTSTLLITVPRQRPSLRSASWESLIFCVTAHTDWVCCLQVPDARAGELIARGAAAPPALLLRVSSQAGTRRPVPGLHSQPARRELGPATPC